MGSGVKPADSDASPLPKEVGERLRQLRLQAGLTQTELALRMGRPGPAGKSCVCQIGLDLNLIAPWSCSPRWNAKANSTDRGECRALT